VISYPTDIFQGYLSKGYTAADGSGDTGWSMLDQNSSAVNTKRIDIPN
jgi:hypothetical protein